ncbi:hypothetical protein C8R43DRAFT_1000510 [Mycena crocata]|nr:hypothetical protein C8R43DRAFT_1000510 [Mycena crocata]
MSLNDRTSHASRNPGKAVQEARGRKKRDPDQPAPTPAEKATKAKAAKQKKEGMMLYPDYIKALLNNSSQFKAERKVCVATETADGIINSSCSHVFTTQIDPDGFKLADTELQARVNEVLAEGISDEDAQQWMQDVEDKRLLNRVHQLHARTGTRIILFASRGHVDDANRPVVFCIEVCKKPALQMLQEFELWSCTRSNQNLTRDTRASMSAQHQVAEDRLRAFVNDDTVTVSYKNFKVDMQGWPADIPFVCPAQLKTNERLRRIRDGWLNGTISWVKLTPLQAAAVAAELRRSQRKQRKDAGGKHEKASKASKASKKDKRGSKSQPSRRQRDAPSEGEEDEEEEQEEEAEREEDSVTHPRRSAADEEFDADYLLSLLPDFDSTTFPIFDMESLGAGVGQNQQRAYPPSPLFRRTQRPGFDAQGAPAFGVHGAPAFDVHLSSMPATMAAHPQPATALHTTSPALEARPVTVHQLADAHPMQASPSAFISYWPVLADGSNNAARKRKAPEDTDTAKPAKKKRVTGSDASERPKAKPRNKAAAGTSTSRTPRMGPPRATAERDMAVLAAQLPPRA